jgi:selenide,water dikinase
LSQAALTQVLRQLPSFRNANVIVNSNTFGDAGIYRLDRRRALVQTVDFFTPIVDDPFAYGQIAAANALSDVFAMGGRPLTALNIMGFPTKLVSPKTITAILRGGAMKAAEAGCAIIGGHSIRNPEPIYGLAVTGIVDLRKILTNATARVGDLLVLTKPLGTGIVTTAIKRGLASRALEKKVISLMSKINSVGAELAEKKLVHAATDVTGFGLIGHLANICRASNVSAEIDPSHIPLLDRAIVDLIKRGCVPGGTLDNLAAANSIVNWRNVTSAEKTFLTDAQTSGGLLLSVAARSLNKVLRVLKKADTPAAAVVGKIVRRNRGPIVCMTK